MRSNIARTCGSCSVPLSVGGGRLMRAGLQLREEFDEVVAQSGCLACHKISHNGNTGPGPDLSEIGARLPRQAIARTLVNPTAPMPAYTELADEQRDNLVEFLAQLKSPAH